MAPFIQMGFPSKLRSSMPMCARDQCTRVLCCDMWPMRLCFDMWPMLSSTCTLRAHTHPTITHARLVTATPRHVTPCAWLHPAVMISFTRGSLARAARLCLWTCAGAMAVHNIGKLCMRMQRGSTLLIAPRSDCRVCGLKLASSVQLARSYHHICPVAAFTG